MAELLLHKLKCDERLNFLFHMEADICPIWNGISSLPEDEEPQERGSTIRHQIP